MSERSESADSRKRIRKLQKNLTRIAAERDLYKKAVEDAYEKYRQLAPSIEAGARTRTLAANLLSMSTILRKALEQSIAANTDSKRTRTEVRAAIWKTNLA